jgi:hypothetical protein
MRIAVTTLLSVGCLLLCGVAVPDVLALPSHAPLPSRPAMEDSANHVATFSGKILSQNGEQLILRDDSNEVWYHLDDQQTAAKFLGKKVLVTGALDGRTDTIHVQRIVEA